MSEDPRVLLEEAREVEYLAVKEYASLMRVSERTVYRMIWGHEIPACRVRGQWRIGRKKPRLRPAHMDTIGHV